MEYILMIAMGIAIGMNTTETQTTEVVDKSWSDPIVTIIPLDMTPLPDKGIIPLDEEMNSETEVVEEEEVIIGPKIFDEELEFRNMAVQVLGGLNFYTSNCGQLTELGNVYKSQIMETFNLDKDLMTLDQYYIDGMYAASTYETCDALYEVIDSIGGADMVTKGW